MNIVELGQGQLSWRLPALVSGVGTLIVIVLILLGKVVWKLIRERILNDGWKSRYQHLSQAV